MKKKKKKKGTEHQDPTDQVREAIFNPGYFLAERLKKCAVEMCMVIH